MRRFTLRYQGRLIRRGLTLTELLVVIAIIVLLAGLLVPALAGLRDAGRSTSCLNNLRQIAVAANQYAMNHRYYPPAIRWEQTNGAFTTVAWDYIHAGSEVEPGPLWAYAGPGDIHQCPAYDGPDNFGGDPYTGYNYNTTYIGGEAPYGQNWDHPDYRPPLRFGRAKRPAGTAIFGDGGASFGANKFMRAPMNTIENGLQTVYGGGQAFRHGGRTNVAYLDGHVAAVQHPRKGRHATESLLQLMGHPENGFLSDDDRAYDPNWTAGQSTDAGQSESNYVRDGSASNVR